jgi:phosphomannomutase
VTAAVAATGRDALRVAAGGHADARAWSATAGRPAGIQISASHNPPEYNGLKFFQPEGMVLGPAEGRAVLDRIRGRQFGWAAWDAQGQIRDLEAPLAEHLRRVVAVVEPGRIRARAFKVVLDAGHGAGGRLGAELLREALGCEVLVLGGEPDGRYDHPPEPTQGHLRTLAAIVPAVGADVGFAQDPDADRLAIVDQEGRYIGEELTLALAAQRRLAQETGPVVLNLSTSRVVEDLAGRLGCPVLRTPVGEIHVVERMRAVGAVLGGEGNGGVIDPRVGFVRDSFVAMALVLDLLAQDGGPLSRLVDALPRYAMVKEKYPLGEGPPVAELLDRLAGAHRDARADRRDGLRLDWPDGWVHVRPSNTEPIVRVIAEARGPPPGPRVGPIPGADARPGGLSDPDGGAGPGEAPGGGARRAPRVRRCDRDATEPSRGGVP